MAQDSTHEFLTPPDSDQTRVSGTRPTSMKWSGTPAPSGGTSPPQPCHLGRGLGFVDKDEPFRSSLHPGLPVRLPYAPGTNNVSASGSLASRVFLTVNPC
jgi:hypothetical protein